MASWRTADPEGVASCFAQDARFIAFDGSLFEGAQAIAQFHGEAFDGPCKDTEIVLKLTAIRALASGVLLALSHSSIRSKDSGVSPTGPSIQTLVIIAEDGEPLIASLQNTRQRPITSMARAEIWTEFDEAWSRRA